MTKIFPSRLKTLFFTKIFIEAVQHEGDGPGELTSSSIEYKKDCYKNSQNELAYSLEIKSKSLDPKDCSSKIPYVFSIEAVAVCSLDYDPSPSEVDRAKYFSDQAGYTALIGAIREILASYSARGPWGSVILPLIPIQALTGPYPKAEQASPEKIESGEKKPTRPRKTLK